MPSLRDMPPLSSQPDAPQLRDMPPLCSQADPKPKPSIMSKLPNAVIINIIKLAKEEAEKEKNKKKFSQVISIFSGVGDMISANPWAVQCPLLSHNVASSEDFGVLNCDILSRDLTDVWHCPADWKLPALIDDPVVKQDIQDYVDLW